MEGFLRPVVQWLVGFPTAPWTWGPPFFPSCAWPRVWKNTHSFSPLTPQAIFRDGLSPKKYTSRHNWHIFFQPFKKLKVTKYTPSFRGRKPRHLPFKFQTSFGGLEKDFLPCFVVIQCSNHAISYHHVAVYSLKKPPDLQQLSQILVEIHFWSDDFSNSTTTSWQ